MLTPTQLKRAVILYDRYKTETREYHELAESIGWSTGELNRYIWQIKHEERKRKELAKQSLISRPAPNWR